MVVAVLRCSSCGYDYSDDERQAWAEDEFDGCPACGHDVEPEVMEVDLLAELVEAAEELGAHAAMIIERQPALRERIEAELSKARAYVRTSFKLELDACLDPEALARIEPEG